METPKRRLEIELTEDEIEALENFLRRSISSDYRIRAQDTDEAKTMANAARKLREAIIKEKHNRH